MTDFFQEYFINPIVNQNDYAPYNVYNTAAFALIALVSVYLIFRFLKSRKVPIDDRFAKTLLPYVLFGGFFRVWEDAHIIPRAGSFLGLPGFFFVTPGIYVLIFLLLSATTVLAWSATKNIEKTTAAVQKAGILYAGSSLLGLVLLFKNFVFAGAVLVLAGLAYATIRFVFEHRKIELPFVFHLMIFGQVLDGAATFVGTGFAGYSEQHVVGGALISGVGPWAFFVLKIAFAALAAEFLRRETDSDARNFVAFLIALFGLAPGTRDLTRMLCGV